ncbi:MAG: YigZ family protein [Acholeplasmataceae bacterium]|jgi:uncharacterized YigZ family protein|nr:YigZ family protein [Acholeplasmataceae bacterium]MCK9233562.1 YigZ family protein [Acholeplasmataceae bacterium]MCK9288794.1 YigZ family protein [Acholeplasmataceae bacterium]MCK9427300.1 YigZ family protein [Acholeplasmataceae bacterium]HHT39694.1 YigZ family protein [Acholeplasmataceae bacterium]
MNHLKETITTELIIKKSRFLTFLIPVQTIEEINNHLREIKKNHFHAAHHCYAYLLDDQLIQRSNDDGEPKGTAGIPILEALKQYNMTDVLCVVTRFFGGILLGKGGLIRAYQSACLSALKKASFYKEAFKDIFKITLPYPLYDSLKYYLGEQAIIIKETFLEDITLELYFTSGSSEDLLTTFPNDITIEKIKTAIVKIDH